VRSGIASLPLHWGAAPRWLFGRMVRLCRAITEVIAGECAPDEVLRRFSDPVWFQSLGCVLGFDWHSSGVTTTVCGALKEAVRGRESDIGIFVCGGKGGASRQTPTEISGFSERFGLDGGQLLRASRLSAKVDSAALQDGYQLYHHVFIGTLRGRWAVVQQGMNTDLRRARRYHWLAESLSSFCNEPHKGVVCDERGGPLNMVAAEADLARAAVVELARARPETTVREYGRIRGLTMPTKHPVGLGDMNTEYLSKVLLATYERGPEDFAELLLQPGVGAKTVRALALIAEVTHGAVLSYRDPVTYSFALGGKDGWPYPVDRQAYDRSVQFMELGIREARLGRTETLDAFRRLGRWSRSVGPGGA
jgi:hypothetical protein